MEDLSLMGETEGGCGFLNQESSGNSQAEV
jgi:hypothetical protein